jgi:hypothetical protein
MHAQLKTLIDRTAPRYRQINDKDFYYIATMADHNDSAMDNTFDAIRGFTIKCLSRAKEKGVIRGSGAWAYGKIKNTPAMGQAFEMVKQI